MSKMLLLLSFISVHMAHAQVVNTVEKVSYTYEVFPLKKINTPYNDMCPVVNQDQLVFASDRLVDLNALGENDWSKNAYFSLFQTALDIEVDGEGAYKKPQAFSFHINGRNHTGPATFTSDGKVLVTTKIPERKKFFQKLSGKQQTQLYKSTRKGGKWEKLEKLPFCDPAYSYGHPAFSSDNKRLYFSSNLPGGYGGKDLWYSEKVNGKWTKPVNLGAKVNSEEDEMFPSVVGGILHFASNGHSDNLGGLDLFRMASAEENEDSVMNLGPTINTAYDEFALYVDWKENKKIGYFSSNRPDGEGQDDIYRVKVNVEVTVKKSRTVAGKFEFKSLDGDDAKDMEVQLLDGDGNVVMTALTDANGEFSFRELEVDGEYTIKLADAYEDVLLTLYGENKEGIAFLMSNSEGEFVFKKLALDKVGTLGLIDEVDIDLSTNTADFLGQFIYAEDPSKFTGEMKVKLVNEYGAIVHTTTTDALGNFEFKNLPLDKGYMLKLDERDDVTELTLLVFNRYSQVVAELKSDSEGSFVFKELPLDNLSSMATMDEEMTLDMPIYTMVTGYLRDTKTKERIGSIALEAYSQKNLLLGEEMTNERGAFRYRYLPTEDQYLFKLKENSKRDMQLVVTDRFAEELDVLDKDDQGYFVYKVSMNKPEEVKEEEKQDLDLIVLNGELAKIFYAKNSSKIEPSSAVVLRDIAKKLLEIPELQLEVVSHTDARASDQYNMELSEKRTSGVISYLIRKGVDASRLSGRGAGETELVNHCKDGVSCSDAEHGKNRRTEFRFYEK